MPNEIQSSNGTVLGSFSKTVGARPRSSFPHAPGGNPDSSSSLDPRQEHAGVTEWTLSCISRIPQALETAVVPTLIEKIWSWHLSI
jgi:hypothetical protein